MDVHLARGASCLLRHPVLFEEQREGFCLTLLARVVELGSLCQNTAFSTEMVVEYTRTLMKITEQVRKSPTILARLKKEGYLYRWTKTILALHPRFGDHEMMLPLARSQLNNICAPYRPPLKNLTEALESGLMPVIIDLLRKTSKPPRGDTAKKAGLNLFNLFCPYVWYPEGLRALFTAIRKMPREVEEDIVSKRHIDPDWGGVDCADV
ncbi:hypothetical protein CC2G_004298 [Coprinopsis cinerea AmutBmut pab1-1]|nr:hypothetical protein CC2G_004298 [Coprinopsis cinerea AmutBmut pab1-1]